MSTEKEKASEEAWENIDMCCQTLCDKDKVVEYIKRLEVENELLRAMIAIAAKT